MLLKIDKIVLNVFGKKLSHDVLFFFVEDLVKSTENNGKPPRLEILIRVNSVWVNVRVI